MKLTLERSYFGSEYTIGHLYVDGEFFCDTIEDRYRDLSKEKKVYGETSIPFGVYDIELTYSPKYTEKMRTDQYFRRFSEMRGNKLVAIMPELKDVPYFSGIRIHPGTTQIDSYGCLIVGENKKKGCVLNSRATFSKLYAVLKNAADCGERITINIIGK